MLLSYNLPRDWAYDIDNGTFLTAPAALHDRMPAEAVQIEWDDTDPQTTSIAVTIYGDRTVPFVPRVGAILGTDLPEGLRIEICGKRPADSAYDYALGGNSLTQTLTWIPGHGIGAVWVFDAGLDPINGYAVKLYNDAGGAVAIAPEAEKMIGEIIVAPAIVLPHSVGPDEKWSELRASESIGAQLQMVTRTVYRTLTISPVFGDLDDAFGNGLTEGTDWQRVQAALAADPFALAVRYYDTPELIQRTSIFGRVSGLGIGGLAGRYQRPGTMTIRQVPA